MKINQIVNYLNFVINRKYEPKLNKILEKSQNFDLFYINFLLQSSSSGIFENNFFGCI